MDKTTKNQDAWIKTMEQQGERGKSTIIVGECNIPLWVIDRFRRQKFSKDKNDIKSTHHQQDLINI